MIQHRLDQDANQAASRYNLLTDAWQAHFSRSMNLEDFGTSTHAKNFLREAYEMAQTYLEQEASIGETALRNIATDAHQTTLREISSIAAEALTERVTEHLSDAHLYFINEIHAQIARDLTLMRKSLQRVGIEVYASSRSRGISQRSAMLEYRIGNSSDLEFAFYDRSCRKWMSRKFIRAHWRQTLLSVYNETVLLDLADHGIRRARVVHQDVDAESHNTLISFGSNTGLPTYSEIRDVIFHPNSNAILAMEMTNVSP